MRKTWVLTLIILLNHMLFQSVMAEVHVAQSEQERFESPHFHIDSHENSHHVSLADAEHLEAADHHKNSHIHCHCDLNNVAVFDADPSQKPAARHQISQINYLELSYKPAVPPPTV